MLPPLDPCVFPIVPQCTVPVLSNVSSERKLYTSNTDSGKLRCLSCPKLNIIIVPCVVSPELRSRSLSPTSKIYVYPGGQPTISTPVLPFVPVADPPVSSPLAINLIALTAVVESSATLVANPTALFDLSASAKPFFSKPFHHHHYKPDCLDDLIQKTTNQISSSNWGDFICTVRGRSDLHSDIANILHPAAHLPSRFQKVGAPAIMSGAP